jgi:hypothetical protein
LFPEHIFDQPLNVETQPAQLRLSPSSMPPAQFVEQRFQIAGRGRAAMAGHRVP